MWGRGRDCINEQTHYGCRRSMRESLRGGLDHMRSSPPEWERELQRLFVDKFWKAMRLFYGPHCPTEQANHNLLTLSKDSNPYPCHAPPGSTEASSAPSRVPTR